VDGGIFNLAKGLLDPPHEVQRCNSTEAGHELRRSRTKSPC
jgi:hypothetical protein